MPAFSKLKLRPPSFVERVRGSVFVAWIVLVTLKQYKDFKQKEALGEGGSDFEETVKVHGAQIKFTQTHGGTVGFGLLNSLEFWLPVAVRAFDARMMQKQGPAYFKHFSAPSQFAQLVFGVFSLTPLAEAFLPEDWSNPTKDQQRSQKKNNPVYKAPLFLWTLVELYSTFVSFKFITGEHSKKMSLLSRIFILISTGFFNGAIGITASHELIHKNKLLDKIAGYLLLCNVNYMHWGEEHLTGHHENVATMEDPATSRFGESLYKFFPRTLIGSFKSAVNLEKRRLMKKDKSDGLKAKVNNKLWWLRPDNRMIWNVVLPMVYSKLLEKVTGGGWKTIGAFYIQGILAASMLEVINYVEHYGLMRDKNEDGKYEPVDPTHSWNSPHRLSNGLLFKLQRHSDHHTYASRPYQLLRNFKESPQLPTGYPGMYLMSFFPPVFSWVMDPLVKAHLENKERLSKLAIDDNAEYSFSKSAELIEVERTAKRRLVTFLGGVAGLHVFVSRLLV